MLVSFFLSPEEKGVPGGSVNFVDMESIVTNCCNLRKSRHMRMQGARLPLSSHVCSCSSGNFFFFLDLVLVQVSLYLGTTCAFFLFHLFEALYICQYLNVLLFSFMHCQIFFLLQFFYAVIDSVIRRVNNARVCKKEG